MKTQHSKKLKNQQGVEVVTNYADAVDWLRSDYVLCNNIATIDLSVWDNCRFDSEAEDAEEGIVDIYQWFLTSASESDVEYLRNRFGLLFSYSELLDVFVLCVPHYGTAWDYVDCSDTEADEFWQEQYNGSDKND